MRVFFRSFLSAENLSQVAAILHLLGLNTTDSANNRPVATSAAVMALVPLGVLINLGIGTIVHLLKLPLFIDAVGTIVVTILIGIRWGVVTGVLSFLIGGIITNPVLPYFSGTQAVIAVVAGLWASHGWFRSVPRTIVVGICVGVAAGCSR